MITSSTSLAEEKYAFAPFIIINVKPNRTSHRKWSHCPDVSVATFSLSAMPLLVEIAFILALLAFATCAQFFVSEDARMVSVFPDGGQAIAPDWFDIHQRGLFNAQARFILQHAWLAAFARAPGARAGPAQRFPAMYTFVFIAPDQGKLPLVFIQHE